MLLVLDRLNSHFMFRIKTAIRGPRALVLSPTRELAVQIHQEVQKYNYCNIRRLVYL